jgi:hypothetical protein
MSTEQTVSPEKTASEPERNVLPTSQPSSIQKLENSAEKIAHTQQPETGSFTPIESPKRKKTRGERLFDFLNYGGFGLVGNEVASLVIMKQTKPEGLIHKPYESFRNFFTKLEGKKFVPEYATSGRLPYVVFACIGGMFMVLPIKYFEDRKGAMVRKLDQKLHSKQENESPAIVAAHQEMDNAPRQTWASLWKGRVVTVFSALAADSVFGWEKGVLAKALKGTKAERFSSLDHIANETAKKWIQVFKTAPEKQIKTAETVNQFTWLLTLSTTLTILFYATSKLFAKNQAIHKEQREERREQRLEERLANNKVHSDDAPNISTAPQEKESEKPGMSITHVAQREPLQQPHVAPQLQ